MKNYFFIFTMVLLTHFMYGQIHSGEINYKIRYNENIKKSTKKIKDPEVKNYIVKILKEQKETAPYLFCTLNFNSTESFFERRDMMGNDNGMDLNRTYGIAAGQGGVFYTNLENNLGLNQFKSSGRKLLIQMNLDSLDWHITGETKKIKGYLCQKAEVVVHLNAANKGTVTAWFTPDIPFQFGPLQFAGLPGMILGLERNHFYFYADKIKLSEKDKTIKRPSEGKQMTWDEFYGNVTKAVERNRR